MAPCQTRCALTGLGKVLVEKPWRVVIARLAYLDIVHPGIGVESKVG